MKANSRVNVDPNFHKLVEKIQKWSKEAAADFLSGNQVKWLRPDGTGLLTEYTQLAELFSRKQVNQEAVEAMLHSNDPGATGDLIAAITQIDYLATAGRAFLSRHARGPCRTFAHLAARWYGHGLASGPINMNAAEFVNYTLKAAKEK